MIEIKHSSREIIIPQAEKILEYSSFVYSRMFKMARHYEDDSGEIKDLNDYTYVLNYNRYGETTMHHTDLTKTSDDNYIYLKWVIDRGCTEIPGQLTIEVYGVKNDDENTFFSSPKGFFTVSKDIADGNLDLVDPSKYLSALLSHINKLNTPTVNGNDWKGDIKTSDLNKYGIYSISDITEKLNNLKVILEDYNKIKNKAKINDTEILGNKTLVEYGLADEMIKFKNSSDPADEETTSLTLSQFFTFVNEYLCEVTKAVGNKQDELTAENGIKIKDGVISSEMSDSIISHIPQSQINISLTGFLNSIENIEIEDDSQVTFSDGTTAYTTQVMTTEENLKEQFYPNTDGDAIGYGWKFRCTHTEANDLHFFTECERKVKLSYNGKEFKDAIDDADNAETILEDLMSLVDNEDKQLDVKYKDSILNAYLVQTDEGFPNYWIMMVISTYPIKANSDNYTVNLDKYQTTQKVTTLEPFSHTDIFDKVSHFKTSDNTECSVIIGSIDSNYEDAQKNLGAFHNYFGINSLDSGFGALAEVEMSEEGQPNILKLKQCTGKLDVSCGKEIGTITVNSDEEYLSLMNDYTSYIGQNDYSQVMVDRLVDKVFYAYFNDISNEITQWIFFICVATNDLKIYDVKLSSKVLPESTYSAIEALKYSVETKQPKLTAGENIIIEGNVISATGSGSGGGGTSDYKDLTNKPTINSVELIGNKTLNDLGLPAEREVKVVADIILENDVSSIYYTQSIDGTLISQFKRIWIYLIGATSSTGSASHVYFNLNKGSASGYDLYLPAGLHATQSRNILLKFEQVTNNLRTGIASYGVETNYALSTGFNRSYSANELSCIYSNAPYKAGMSIKIWGEM